MGKRSWKGKISCLPALRGDKVEVVGIEVVGWGAYLLLVGVAM